VDSQSSRKCEASQHEENNKSEDDLVLAIQDDHSLLPWKSVVAVRADLFL
jgi:hypothetical protein